ncbi:MAG TPA: hypothetical protein VE011_07395 [Candidatus Dormibacteraeota bacterium]|jgi:hypothetical protein|nr:hypothetical protein [Candidatus Dormibacteraeota bacterium]
MIVRRARAASASSELWLMKTSRDVVEGSRSGGVVVPGLPR